MDSVEKKSSSGFFPYSQSWITLSLMVGFWYFLLFAKIGAVALLGTYSRDSFRFLWGSMNFSGRNNVFSTSIHNDSLAKADLQII